jgi:hypothetical protein
MVLKMIPALVVGLVATSPGAVISWSGASAVSSSNDVSTLGTLVEAYNPRADTTDLEVNGVTFTYKSDILASVSTSTAQGGGLDVGDVAYDTMFDILAWGGGASTTITVGGDTLVSGQEYLVQTWYVQSDKSGRIMTYGDGLGNTVDVSCDGEYASGSFTADGTSQTISLAATGMGNCQLTAYQVRAIPEPGTLGLVAVFGGGILFLRRKFKI